MFATDLLIDENLKNEKVLKYKIVDSYVKSLPEGSKVFEFGCGVGTLARSLANKFKHNYSGFDVDVEAVNLANEKNDNITYSTTLPIDKQDVIFAIDVLEHIQDPSIALTNLKAILKKDGVAIFHIPLEKSGIYKWKRCIQIKDIFSEHEKHYSYEDFKQLIVDSDMTITKSYYHYHIISGFRDFFKYWTLYKSGIQADKKNIFYTVDWGTNLKVNATLLKCLDFLAYYETRLLNKLKLFSCGVTVICKHK